MFLFFVRSEFLMLEIFPRPPLIPLKRKENQKVPMRFAQGGEGGEPKARLPPPAGKCAAVVSCQLGLFPYSVVRICVFFTLPLTPFFFVLVKLTHSHPTYSSDTIKIQPLFTAPVFFNFVISWGLTLIALPISYTNRLANSRRVEWYKKFKNRGG